MIAADTNVWARAHLNDDPAQARRARSAIAQACAEGGVFVPLVVMAELYWVLRSRWQKERVLDTLQHMVETDGVSVEDAAVVTKALREAHSSGAGFADLLIAHVSFEHGAAEVITFDKAFARLGRVRRLAT